MKQLLGLIFLAASLASAQQQPTQGGVSPIALSRSLTVADCDSQVQIADTGSNGIKIPPQTSTGTIKATYSSGTNAQKNCKDTVQDSDDQTTLTAASIDVSSSLLSGVTYGNLLTKDICTTGSKTPNTWSYFCIYNQGNLVAQINYQYDTTPNKIKITGINPGNKQIAVTLNDPKLGQSAGYTPTYEVCYGPDPSIIDALTKTANSCPTDPITSSSTSLTISGLKNWTQYYVVARVQGSPNQWSPSSSTIPMPSDGFSKVYDGASNPLSWSCTQTPATPGSWVLFLALALFLLPVRKKSPLVPLFQRGIGVLLLVASPVAAHPGQINLSLTGAPYRPNLDSSTKTDGSTARSFYGTMFSDKLLPLMGLETDVHLFDGFGSLQLGLGLSYAYAGGNALLVNQNGELTQNRSNDSAALHMLHIRPQLTYILDSWVDQIPLAPYIRGGIVSVGYLFTYQGGIDKEGGANPMGFVFGYEAAAGLMLALDWLEPSVSKSARANGVYDHVYLKAEAAYMPINNFHQKGLNFSTRWPTPDLPLLLTFGLVFEFK